MRKKVLKFGVELMLNNFKVAKLVYNLLIKCLKTTYKSRSTKNCLALS